MTVIGLMHLLPTARYGFAHGFAEPYSRLGAGIIFLGTRLHRRHETLGQVPASKHLNPPRCLPLAVPARRSISMRPLGVCFETYATRVHCATIRWSVDSSSIRRQVYREQRNWSKSQKPWETSCVVLPNASDRPI
jgi:hypothetical protein